MTVGRFAPSPSGRMHLGNVFTALLAWLSVRSRNGTMLLRIEDLDPQRSRREYIEALRDDLTWLGLDWDREMPLQSERTEIYERYFEKLPTYPCFCARNELHAASAPHASDGRIIYPGTCRALSEEERRKQAKKPSWRAAVEDETISFVDGVCGSVSQSLKDEWGDFIVRRSDGVYAYQLAVVCDDALGGVTQVVRGRDLLTATAPQIWLYRKLGFSVPSFYHVPLLVAPDGRRLSKRERDLDMEHLRAERTAQEVVGKLAFLAGLTQEAAPCRPCDLVSVFSWDKISDKDLVIGNDF